MRTTWMVLILLALPWAALAQVEFSEETVLAGYDGALNVASGDLDGDGDMDIVGAAETADYYVWVEQTDDGWVSHPLAPNLNGPTNVMTADLDDDGDLDILGASYTDDVAWWENDGVGNFTSHILTSYDWTKGIDVWDFDNDGDLDMAVCAEGGGEVVWLEQTDPGNDDWPVHIIADFSSASNLDVDDIDGDGDPDIAVCGRFSSDIGWIENLGGGGWTTHILDDSFGESRSVKVADMNGDDLFDIVATARSGKIAFWEQTNDGDWTYRTITTTFSGADDVVVVDIDLDDDLDVVGAAVTADEVAWFEQTDDGWVQHTIATQDYVSGVHATDIDNDGDADIVSAGYYSDDIRLFTQLGEPIPDPVTFDITPQNTTIPPNGGQVTYGLSLVSILPNAVPGLTYWTEVVLPNGQTYGPLTQVPFTMQPFMDVEILNMNQAVPGGAPGGVYEFVASVGFYGTPTFLSDDFTFEKIGAGADQAGTFNPQSWAGSRPVFDSPTLAGRSPAAPEEFSLSSAWPNPFNSTTTLTVSLPQSGNLTVSVHNVLGQQVRTVMDGWHAAGTHAVQLDASGLSAGVYFVRANGPGAMDEVRKISYVK